MLPAVWDRAQGVLFSHTSGPQGTGGLTGPRKIRTSKVETELAEVQRSGSPPLRKVMLRREVVGVEAKFCAGFPPPPARHS